MEVPPKSDEESSKPDTASSETAKTKRPARSRLYRTTKTAKVAASVSEPRESSRPPVAPAPAPEPVVESPRNQPEPAEPAAPAQAANEGGGGQDQAQQGADGGYDDANGGGGGGGGHYQQHGGGGGGGGKFGRRGRGGKHFRGGG